MTQVWQLTYIYGLCHHWTERRMSQRGNRRRLLLFFAAIIVPSIDLFAPILCTRDQWGGLVDKRQNEDRLRCHGEIIPSGPAPA